LQRVMGDGYRHRFRLRLGSRGQSIPRLPPRTKEDDGARVQGLLIRTWRRAFGDRRHPGTPGKALHSVATFDAESCAPGQTSGAYSSLHSWVVQTLGDGDPEGTPLEQGGDDIERGLVLITRK
jgi:hypothetical protein